ncbi:MAG: hypothetical protein P3B98_11555 [Gemmatimonadota bacterium]|nr:hypothetical protein [Gemmatimonadota bacterium]
MRAFVACCLAAPAGTLAAQGGGADAWTRITYISGETIYLEVGSRQGLTDRTTLDVVRGGITIARLRVTALSSGRAACEMLPPPVELAIGDSVRYVAAAVPTAPAARTASAAGGAARRADAPTLRGRVGLRYLVIAADGDGSGGLTQPAYDLRLDGRNLAGGLAVAADVRAQRTKYAAVGAGPARAAVNATRVYQASLAWAPGLRGLRLTAGRQLAGALSTVGIFDGVGVDLDRAHWSTGGFAGSQPDVASFGLSGRVREFGAYAQWHARQGSRQSMDWTLGGVGSYVSGAVDREYAFARFTTNGPLFSVYATQELDFNRGWKRDVEHTSTTPTATFASVHVTPSRAVSVYGGFDNRRSVRLYRDYQSPEIAFDDAFREGTWAGFSLAAPRYARMSIDRRDSRGGSNGQSSATTFSASATGWSRARLGLRARGTQFDGPFATGTLVSGAVEADPWGVVRLEANGGARQSTASGASAGTARLSWWGVDADIGIGRSLYVLLSTYREREAGRASTQTYASISWRF